MNAADVPREPVPGIDGTVEVLGVGFFGFFWVFWVLIGYF